MKFSFDDPNVYPDCQAKIMDQKDMVEDRLPYLENGFIWLIDQAWDHEKGDWSFPVYQAVMDETPTSPDF